MMFNVREATFVGIDLAWRDGKKPSGIAVLRGDRQRAQLLDVTVLSFADVLTRVERHTVGTTVVAIDAPLIICNEFGQRPCETLISRKYGAQHAACHSSNLNLYPDAASVRLAGHLESLGFRHAPGLDHLEDGRAMLEVYPHPALLELFRLPYIIKYKKGNVRQRRLGQQELQRRLKKLSEFSPPLESTPKLSTHLGIETDLLGGVALKNNEDQLDAIVCAYIAYYYWFWGSANTLLFGDLESGYVVVPTLSDGAPGIVKLAPKAV